MDNQFNNGFQNAQPQRPFTEKTNPTVPVNPGDAYDFQPQKPLMQQPVPEAPQNMQQPVPEAPQNMQQPVPEAPQNMQQPAPEVPQNVQQPMPFAPQNVQQPVPEMQQNAYSPAAEQPQGYNPIEHTATYADNRFVNQQYPPQPMRQENMPPRPGYYAPRPTQPVPDYSDARPYTGRPEQQPRPYAQSMPLQERPFEPQRTAAPAPKSKTNKGLIIVIVVLSVLLMFSIGGMIFMTFQNGSTKEETKNNGDNPFNSFTIPNGGFEMPAPNEQSTQPAENHKESDYSDKVIKDFEGLKLNGQPADKDDKKYNSTYAYDKVSDAVVSIQCCTEKDGTVESQGSGTIITKDGYVVTNAHVIGNSKTMYSLKVIDAKGKTYTAGVVGFDSRTDLAVLKMDGASNLTAVEFGDSEKLELGDDLIIIGNPGGIDFANSMTKGVVSALNRDASSKNLVKYIQTDAAINPGNSGGPAVNLYGQVIGIASAKIVKEEYEGMGFCIPSATVKSIVDDLMKNGYVSGRVKIGISGNAISAAAAQEYGVKKGIYAQTVDKDGPCGKAGVKEGEIVTAFDGTEISSFSEIYNLLEQHKEGDKVKIKLYDPDTKKEREVEITLQADK